LSLKEEKWLKQILLFAQISIFRHFCGKERGKFEYVYRERLISKEGKRLLLKEIGKKKYIELSSEEKLNLMGSIT